MRRGSVKQVRQFVGLLATIVGSFRTLLVLSEPLMALTQKGPVRLD